MSTRSCIGVKLPDGTINAIYCHFDGYPDHHFPILVEHYNSQELAEALVELGDMSVLAESIECPEGHSFDSKFKDYSVYYGRDRGEDGVEFRNYPDEEALNVLFQDYMYLWDGTKWMAYDTPYNASYSDIKDITVESAKKYLTADDAEQYLK